MVMLWSQEPPTLCPNDHVNRTLDTSLTSIVTSISTNKVNIEDNSPGYYQQTTLKLSIPAGNAGDITNHDFSWPTEIYVMKTQLMPESEHKLDEINVVAAPNTVIGAVIQPANIGDEYVYITPATFSSPNVINGLDVTFKNGGVTEDKIIELMDSDNFRIKLASPLTQTFNAGTYLFMNLHIIKNLVISSDKFIYESGTKGIQNKHLPAKTILRFFYKNNSGTAKDVHIIFEYKYL